MVASISRRIGAGAGTSAPGVLIDRLDPGFVRRRSQRLAAETALLSGTNGKTTTAAMLASILETSGKRVVTNPSGANLARGVAAALAVARGDEQAAVFEVDEAALPNVAADIQPSVLVLTNVFRDQLDRFGEPENVVRLLAEAAHSLPDGSLIVANADDPFLWHAVEDLDPIGFGVRMGEASATVAGHDAEPEICPRCGGETRYRRRTLAHLGVVECARCAWTTSDPSFVAEVVNAARIDELRLSIDGLRCNVPLGGTHNAYNAVAALAAASALGVPPATSVDALSTFDPKFGRAEWLGSDERSFCLLLVKNPASGATATRQVVSDPRIRAVVVMVNDRAADGRDVSWIWDAGFEALADLTVPIVAAGTRAYDVALRFRYAGSSVDAVETDVGSLLETIVSMTEPGDRVAVLATYTAMLDFRGAVFGSRAAQVSDATQADEPIPRAAVTR